MSNKITLLGENSFKSNLRFDNPSDLYTRYSEIRDKNPLAKVRENLLAAYKRLPIVNKRNGGKKEPNHGQLKMKVDDHHSIFVDFATESPDRFTPVIMRCKDRSKKDIYEKQISAAFKKAFIDTWEELYSIETKTFFDMAMYSKGVMFWPSKKGFAPQYADVNDVFPDLGSRMDPKTMSLLFVRDEISLIELYDMAYGENSHLNETMGWNKKAIDEILEHPDGNLTSKGTGFIDSYRNGTCSSSLRNMEVGILHCFVKEYKTNENGYRITKYIMPSNGDFFGDGGEGKRKLKNFLYFDPNHGKCMRNVIALRSYNITDKYWDSASFAELIYLSCAMYDQATNAIVRAAIRNMTIFFKTNNDEFASKLRKIGSSEVESIPDGVTMEKQQFSIPVAEISSVIRSVMFEVDKHAPSEKVAGSQNVKGYAITAKEAEIQKQTSGEASTLLIKNLLSLDRFLYKEMYRRAIEEASTEEKEFLNLFKDEMEFYEIPKEVYHPDNIIITPVFSHAGTRSSKISFAMSLFNAVSMQASTDAEKKAKRLLISAHVGESNTDNFMSIAAEEKNVLMVTQKAGGENEDMDNPNLSPSNIPVAKDDNHVIELAIHINDYKVKLESAFNAINEFNKLPSVLKMIGVTKSLDIIKAQDNKGAHIEAHFAYLRADESKKKIAEELYKQFDEQRKGQDTIQAQAEKIVQDFIAENTQSTLLTIKEQHQKAMNEMEVSFTKQMNDIALAKAIEQKEMSKEKAAAKAGMEIAHKQEQQQLEQQQPQQLI